jgi:hypothetical protein
MPPQHVQLQMQVQMQTQKHQEQEHSAEQMPRDESPQLEEPDTVTSPSSPGPLWHPSSKNYEMQQMQPEEHESGQQRQNEHHHHHQNYNHPLYVQKWSFSPQQPPFFMPTNMPQAYEYPDGNSYMTPAHFMQGMQVAQQFQHLLPFQQSLHPAGYPQQQLQYQHQNPQVQQHEKKKKKKKKDVEL